MFGVLLLFVFVNDIISSERCTFDKTRQQVTLKLQRLPSNGYTEHFSSEIINIESVEQWPGFINRLIYLKNCSQETGYPVPWFTQSCCLANGGELSRLMYNTFLNL